MNNKISRLNRKFFLGLSVLVVIAFAGCDRKEPRSATPEIVARVNGEPITWLAFERMRANPALVAESQRAATGSETSAQSLDLQALQRLIESRLLLQEAKSRQFTVAEKSVDHAVKSMRHKFADLKQFGIWMQAQGLTEPELFQSVRDDILVTQVTAALVQDIAVSEDEVKQFFEANRANWALPGDVRLRVIALNSRAAVDTIVQQLRQGADFIALAQRYSMGARSATGGDIGWVKAFQLPSPLREVVASLEAGQAYGPVQRGEDFLVVRLDERRPDQIRPFAEVQAEVKQQLLMARQRVAIASWLETQRAQSKIEIFLHDGAVVHGEG
ncbi:peptidyl-prolyl cis-trans isomerase [Microbulbifer sp. YPW1]|uniref:peptidyl-prolyl cis-trans isomerase n=1 Tax=Microbulbifer sp. YPW1 TaxID=2745199 RepID=UPI001598E9AC|nr:peptidyl-prolyl cis-trans isomerase [Microbulbifer sp. YPW1]QKX18830.1 SurA N-terminal domain-containing protein [Microbulbifer sp. YPW1]